MKTSVIVWDLETVPDLGGFSATNDLVGACGHQSAIAGPSRFVSAQPLKKSGLANLDR